LIAIVKCGLKRANETNPQSAIRNPQSKVMAKTSKIVRNEQRKELVARKAETRKNLKAIIKDKNSTPEQVDEAMLKLQKLPRNSCPIRVRNRCNMTGRPRAYLRKFGVSRIALREKALEGQIPGVVKSSW